MTSFGATTPVTARALNTAFENIDAGSLVGTTLSPTIVSSSLTSVGTLTGGTWNSSLIAGQYGGTGVANTGKTITIGGDFTTSGAFTTTLSVTANTSVTLPTSGTLATTDASSLTSGILPIARLSGSYTGITGVGTLSAGSIPTSLLTGTTLPATIVTSSLTTVGTITTGTWSGLFGAVSGANLTTLNATNLSSGTVNSARLPSVNIGTTSVALSRASGALTLAGITLTSPTFTAPVLGTPASGALSNCTLIPAGQLTGTTLNAGVTASSLTSVGTLTGLTSSQTVQASLGALGTTLGNALIHFKLTSTTTNNDFLLLTANRLAAGSTWDSAAYTIQRLVDATYMGFIRFGDGASGQNVQIGVNATRYVSVSATATNVTGLLTADNIWNTSTATATLTGFQYVVRSTGAFPAYNHFTSMRAGKRNIVTITDSGSLIDQLNPVTYQAKIDDTDDELSASWKDRDLEYGFIAEEVAEVGTGFLAQYRDNGNGGLEPAGWKFHGVVSVLVAEVKELRKRIKALETP